ncbi:MAG: NFACT RNA binding domain-containing protein [Bacillota bacterium]
MPFDGFVLAAIRQELAEKLTGSCIDRVYQPAAHTLVLILRRGRDRRRLLLSAHPTNARAHLLTAPVENPPSPPLFCLVLRKHLEGGRVQKISQPGLDRILILEIEARDEAGAPAKKRLVCEIMGKHSNIILVDEKTGQIVDAIKRYSHALSRYREVLPGRPYLPPPAKGKRNPLILREEEFEQTVLSQPLELPLAGGLAACLDGFSKTLAREVVHRAGLPAEMVLDECGEYELKKLWQALQELMIPARKGQFDPTLVINHIIDFAAFDLTHLAGSRKKGEMNALVEVFYVQKEKEEEINRQRYSLLKLVRKELKSLRKKLAIQEEQFSTVQEADKYRLYGELLMANLHRLDKGLPEAVLENFYDPENKPVLIPLDPARSPVENARAYFKKYSKAKQAGQRAQAVIGDLQKELDYLSGVETSLEQADSLADLLETGEELAEQGYLPKHEKINRKKIGKLACTPELLTFTSSDGFTILVGRNNKQNDYLTTRLAKNNDLWLHTRDIPGAHVIIRAEQRQPTPTTLREAAALAAYYSQARHSQNVPVDYTLRKNVHKPRGARPGFVIYKEQRTITADPDEELVERLKRQ